MNPLLLIPLGLHQVYDPDSNTTLLSWSYLDSDEITAFEIQYYDEDLRKWVAFDGRNGVVQKQQKRGE
jgi:hypothetical protein